ncbi:hypothetical protein ACFL09_00230 [Planctomycetota bacterium]
MENDPADSGTVTPVPSPWLADYLDDAVARRLCVKVFCTTCGAMEFRQGLYARAASAVGLPFGDREDVRVLSELIGQLASLNPDGERGRRWLSAVRLIFCEVWSSVGRPTGECVYQPMLEGTWAGDVLRAMQEHHRGRMEDRRQHDLASSPEAAQARREEGRRLRQQKHAERLARKRERDRLWFEQHPREDSPDV